MESLGFLAVITFVLLAGAFISKWVILALRSFVANPVATPTRAVQTVRKTRLA